jgi:hypothetical protein
VTDSATKTIHYRKVKQIAAVVAAILLFLVYLIMKNSVAAQVNRECRSTLHKSRWACQCFGDEYADRLPVTSQVKQAFGVSSYSEEAYQGAVDYCSKSAGFNNPAGDN